MRNQKNDKLHKHASDIVMSAIGIFGLVEAFGPIAGTLIFLVAFIAIKTQTT